MEKFKPTIGSKNGKTVISIRIDNDVLNRIDELADKTFNSRNEIISQCLEYSINNIEIKENKEKITN